MRIYLVELKKEGFNIKRLKRKFLALFSFLSPSFYNKEDSPEERARKLRDYWNIPQNAQIENIIKLIQKKGIFVFPHNFEKIDGFCQIYIPETDREDEPFFKASTPIIAIWIKGNTSLDRAFFTLAHELGHIMNHHFRKNREGLENLPSEDIYLLEEQEANRFASEFLMPEKAIKLDLKETNRMSNYLELKDKWHTSISSLIRRAHDLRKISDKRYKSLNVEISAKKWRTCEPGSVPIKQCRNLFFLEGKFLEIYKQHLKWDENEILDLFDMIPNSSSKAKDKFYPKKLNILSDNISFQKFNTM